MDLIIQSARLQGSDVSMSIGIDGGVIVALAPRISADAPRLDAGGLLVVPGLVETHFHLDKTCILDRCNAADGSVAEAIRLTAQAKRAFTPQDVYARGSCVLDLAIGWGTTRMRTHVEVDPVIGMRGFDGVQRLARDYAWAMDIEICVFPQEGLLNNPGTDALLIEGLRRGAKLIGATPYADTDPRGQIDRIFEIAREFDVDIDMHLDMGETEAGMQVEYVCRKTEAFGWGGRVAVGHCTQLSLLSPERFSEIAATLAGAGVAVTVLPSTDLYLTGRSHTHAIPRGVAAAHLLRGAGVLCSVATNNVLNPFTPYGDANLLRMANLYANVAQLGRPADLAGCLHMVTDDAARLMRLGDYGVRVGAPADLVLLDAASAEACVAELAQPLWGMKRGRMSFARARPVLHRP
jgi:cytosine deaminase